MHLCKGVDPHFVFLLEFNLVNPVLWGGVWRPSYHRPFKLWLEFEVHLEEICASQGRG